MGRGDTIILESCEYCNSFLNFFPTAAVILDVDADHLDFFKDLADVEHSFRAFAALVPADGLIVANGDDANTADALRGMDYVRFGFAETNDVCEMCIRDRDAVDERIADGDQRVLTTGRDAVNDIGE